MGIRAPVWGRGNPKDSTRILVSDLGKAPPIIQERILAVWILAAKLPDSDLNLGCGFRGGFAPPVSSKEKGPQKSTNKSPTKFTQKFVHLVTHSTAICDSIAAIPPCSAL